MLKRIAKDESGQTLMEYGLVAALVSVMSLFALIAVRGGIGDIYARILDVLATV
jgi:Flp pilus assembly pilin Flp